MNRRRILLYISAFAMILVLAGCGSDEWTGDESFENIEYSEEYEEFEPQYRAYLKQWDRVIERDEFAVKLYKPYKYSLLNNINNIDSDIHISSIVSKPTSPDRYLPNAEWYNNAKKAIAFLREYDLEFAVPPKGDPSYTDFVREGVPESLVLKFYSGGDYENIPELDVMINPDGTVIIRDRDGVEVLRSKTKIDFGKFSELEFSEGAVKITIENSRYTFLIEAWQRVIERGETEVWLYKPYRHYIDSLQGSADPPDWNEPTQEWYDNAKKAIDFLRQYDLEFEPESVYSSTFYGGNPDTLVLNFYSNKLELCAKIDPNGTVVIEGKNADGQFMKLHSTTTVDFDSFAALYSGESVSVTYYDRMVSVRNAWERVIDRNEFALKLDDPHTLQSEINQTHQPFDSLLSMPKWYDNAEKAIEFFRSYNLTFDVFSDSWDFPAESLVFIFCSGGNKENILELRLIVEPNGRVIIEDIDAEGGIFRMQSNATVHFERLPKMFSPY